MPSVKRLAPPNKLIIANLYTIYYKHLFNVNKTVMHALIKTVKLLGGGGGGGGEWGMAHP